MPGIIRTAQLNIGWTPAQIETVMQNLFAASGWGTAEMVLPTPGSTVRHWYLSEFLGAIPSYQTQTITAGSVSPIFF